MTQMIAMPRVLECSVSGCGYNHDGCTAFAITVGSMSTSCDTFVDTGVSGGIGQLKAQVGACKRSDCVHNADLECHAAAITVGEGADLADCLTFEAK